MHKYRWIRYLAALVLALPAAAQAQFLDFDSVCATPPCAVGTLYAPSGVTFAPNTAPIVAAGTNGLTGTSGGSYLSVAAFPYQVGISLARQATFVALNLSRASTSSGTITMQVTLLKAGSPVGSTSVTLTSVNTWSPVALSLAGGFDTIFFDPAGGANNTFGIDAVRFGGSCNGFSDVLPADSFCNATEWLSNRGVTLGCVAGQYCPSQNVTRAQMALFMNRLGNALTPEYLKTVDSQSGAFPLSPQVQICQTTDYLVSGYPRAAFVTAAVQVFGASVSKGIFTKLQYSTDGGTSWSDISGFGFGGIIAPGGQSAWSEIGQLDLQVGVRYRFSLRAIEFAAAGTLTADCELIAQIHNRVSGASAPFDEAASPQPGDPRNR